MMYDAKRHYAFLGVDPGCSDEEIRAAFRRRAKELHPDSESGSESEFIRLKKAYDILAEPNKRAYYDRISRPRAPVRVSPLEWSAPIPRPRRFRLGGMSLARFAAAFVFMTGLSLAALEVILADSGATPQSIFDFSGRRPMSSRDAIRRGIGADPAQVATKGAASMQVGETAGDFAERMQRARSNSRFDGQALGGNPAP